MASTRGARTSRRVPELDPVVVDAFAPIDLCCFNMSADEAPHTQDSL